MLTNKSNQPFHLVDFSPWPLTASIGTMTLVIGLVKWFNTLKLNMLIIGMIIILLTSFQWWRDIVRESTFQGLHTKMVSNGLRWGMMLFITSEVLLFMSFFWTYFHSSLAPTIELGLLWPPHGINPFNPMQIPLLNTIVLLTSGISITWSHHSMMEANYSQSMKSLFMTLIMGFYFTLLQMYEYWEAPFSIADAIYGSSFFLTTGFHGLHVIIGSMFLFMCWMRLYFNHFSNIHHFGFEAAAWYWHFVDVVWLFLYMSVYWWGK
uniref:Cytochrome c oxidase subunit 3 n=1 Tax=Paramastax nigra TaxID=1260743 RepID=M4JDU3_9ORTH|nr:cytochrome c oxidase subunit III [Paramastax nigra]